MIEEIRERGENGSIFISYEKWDQKRVTGFPFFVPQRQLASREATPPSRAVCRREPPPSCHVQLTAQGPSRGGVRAVLFHAGGGQLGAARGAFGSSAPRPRTWRGGCTRPAVARARRGGDPGLTAAAPLPPWCQLPPDLLVLLRRRFLQPPRGPARAERVQKCERAAKNGRARPWPVAGEAGTPGDLTSKKGPAPEKGARGAGPASGGLQTPGCRLAASWGASVRHRKEGRGQRCLHSAAALTDLIKRKEALEVAEPSCRLPKRTRSCSCHSPACSRGAERRRACAPCRSF